MGRLSRVWTVYRKELMETLRDRRTLTAMLLVPVILYPVLMLILVEAVKSEAGRQERQSYRVVVPDEAHRRWLEGVLDREEQEREARANESAAAATVAGREAEQAAAALRTELGSAQIGIEVAPSGASLWELVSARGYQAAVLVQPPPNPDDFADEVNRVVQIIRSDTDPLSEVVYRQLHHILGNEASRITRTRLVRRTGSDADLQPLRPHILSTTSPDRQFARALALVVPFLLVTMTLTGAIYPAIDLTAGERERGTLETLAVSPVPSGQIVAGKFCVIVTIAMATTMLNLGSMTAVLQFGGLHNLLTVMEPGTSEDSLLAEAEIRSRQTGSGKSAEHSQLDYLEMRRSLEEEARQHVGFVTTAAPIVMLSMVPFAVLFSAIMLAVCCFARTFKEAQNYMMPVMMAAIVPAMVVSYMPTVKLEGPILVVPVVNVVILMRELFLGNYDAMGMAFCLLSTCFYAAAAVTVAVRVYGNEAVLFSDVGSYKTLLLRRFMRPQAHPTAAFALLTLAVIFPLNFYVQSSLIDVKAGGARNALVIAGTQIGLFALPALLLAWYTKLDVRRTFALRPAHPVQWAGAALVAVAVVPVWQLLQQLQFYCLPPSKATEALLEQQAALLFGDSPLWLMIVVFALLPGICEEILFRGFLMSGLRPKLSAAQTIVAVGVVFGLFHAIAIKVPIISLLGMLLALVCLRTGSIFPAMLVHTANNGLALAATKLDGLARFFGIGTGEAASGTIHFDARTGVFLLAFAVGLGMIAVRRGGEGEGWMRNAE